MEVQPEIKQPLKRRKDEELKLFFLISRPVQLNIANEGIQVVLGFNLEEVIGKIKIPPNMFLLFKGSLPVNELLNKVQLNESVSFGEKEEIPPREINKERFRNNLLLASDNFVKDEKDKEEIKRIIKSLKL